MSTIPLTLADVAYDIQINQLPNWIRAVEDMTMRSGFLYPRLSQQGGIVREPGAYEDIWKIKVRLPEVRPMVNHQGLSFQPTQSEIQCRTQLRAMETTEAMSLMDQWINSGPNALRKMVNDKGNDLRKAMTKAFMGDVWLSGSSAGRTDRYEGIETGLGSGTAVVADKVAKPDGSYANQATDVATNGGYWSADLGTPNNADAGHRLAGRQRRRQLRLHVPDPRQHGIHVVGHRQQQPPRESVPGRQSGPSLVDATPGRRRGSRSVRVRRLELPGPARESGSQAPAGQRKAVDRRHRPAGLQGRRESGWDDHLSRFLLPGVHLLHDVHQQDRREDGLAERTVVRVARVRSRSRSWPSAASGPCSRTAISVSRASPTSRSCTPTPRPDADRVLAGKG